VCRPPSPELSGTYIGTLDARARSTKRGAADAVRGRHDVRRGR
jgi:hypothetical protein